jgi:hypothetical protein
MTAKGHHKPHVHHPMKHTTADVNIVVDQMPWYARFFQWAVNTAIGLVKWAFRRK